MTIVAVGSLSGSPGATTLAVALARCSPRRVLLVEADADGGRLAARADLAVRPGLTDLAATCRLGLADPEDVWHYAQESPFDGVPTIVAHPAADAVGAALRAAGDALARALRSLDDTDVVIDVGRYRPASPSAALAACAHRRLVVTRPTLDDLALLTHRRDLLDGLGDHTVVCVGRRPYGPGEVARVTGHQVVSLPRRGEGRSAARRYRSSVVRLAASLFEAPAPLPQAMPSPLPPPIPTTM